MKASWWFLVPAVAAALTGLYVSDALLAKHMHFPGTPDWLNAMCESGASTTVSCDTVLASPWGMFPPVRDGDPKNKVRVPVALIGMAYFTALLLWLLTVGRVNREGRWWHLLPLTINACGLLGSIGFIKIMATDLATWCPLCVMSHVANLVLFVMNLLLWPREPREAAKQQVPEATPRALPYPSTRLATVVVVLCLIAVLFELRSVELKATRGITAKLTSAMEEIRNEVGTLISTHMGGTKHRIEFRDDDPVRHRAERVPTLVVWSDFECASCKKFASDLEAKHFDAFSGRLQVVYKHYPLSPDCNPYATRNAHPHACDAARLAEAVRIVGGNDKFWEAHDIFFSGEAPVAQLDAAAMADRLGLDAEQLATVMNSDAVTQRLAEDIEQGHQIGVKGTPNVFLNGRLINSWARGVDNFWKGLGILYNAGRPVGRLTDSENPPPQS